VKRPFLLGTLLALAVLVAACVAPSSVPGGRPDDQSGGKASPDANAAAATGELVYVRKFDGPGSVVALDALTGKQVAALPWGVTTPDWNLLYRVETDGANTAIRALDVKSGRVSAERILTGPYQYELPNVALLGEPGGFSPNARWLALHARGVDYVNKSALAIVDSKLQQPARFVELPGSFYFDALSDSGRYLYLEERLGRTPADGYRVRAYDLQTSTLLPGIVVDKTVTADRMNGTRVATVGSRNGEWQYTLYTRQGGKPFIHAIKLEEQWSLCLFIPVETKDEEDFAWAFVPSPDGTRGYVVNGMKGYVVSIDLNTATVLKTGTFTAGRSQTSPLDAVARFLRPIAEAKSEMFAAAAVSPDGRTLYASGDFGSRIYAIATDTLAPRSSTPYTIAGGVTGLAVSPEGSVLYAMTGDALARLDPATGRELGRAPTSAIGMGRILHVATR